MLACLITNCSFISSFQGMWLIQAFVSVFLAILFLQSGLDKIIDWKGNLGWLTGHFSKSFLSGMVPMLLGTLTLVEIAAGAVSALGVVEVLLYRAFCLSFAGTVLSALALVMLFFGQRMAKDYAGAGGLVPYFILVVINLYFLA
jgi:hypothetical protein